ncbi:MAG TPA: Flp family type IVb pilin [Oligoflexia bacterium]|nr:Flp family type IVb pilin [Oligoflexia bacterium]HMP47082.1 Flp family type IVb pilin [Oligoflexia bacterium]
MDRNIDNLEIVEKKETKEAGATMVEYALLVALIAIALIAVVIVMRGGVSQKFSQVASGLNA